jgi:hypothetical protein
MSESFQDPRFQGGGTPINKLVQSPGPPPQQMHPQQMHPQQMHPQQMHPQQMHPQQMHPQQMHPHQYENSMVKNREVSFVEKFENYTNCSWVKFVCLVILIILMNNSFIYEFEMKLIPVNMRFGQPPLIAVILNALFIGIIFLLISKFL